MIDTDRLTGLRQQIAQVGKRAHAIKTSGLNLTSIHTAKLTNYVGKLQASDARALDEFDAKLTHLLAQSDANFARELEALGKWVDTKIGG